MSPFSHPSFSLARASIRGVGSSWAEEEPAEGCPGGERASIQLPPLQEAGEVWLEWLASAVLPYPRGALSPVLPIKHLQ